MSTAPRLQRHDGEPLTARLVELIRTRPVGEADMRAAALFTLDAAASILAGQRSVPGEKLMRWARTLAPDGGSLDAPRRAFLMGALCHILEMDDLHRASVVHPGCAVVPAIFAMARGRPGHEALTAVLHGFEAATRVGMAVGPAHYRIWHNTATCGPFGSAMAAAYLLGLDDGAAIDALGNAGTQSGGLWEFLETGAHSKHLHAGRAAEAGMVAAGLAAQGFTGAPAILEGEKGIFRAMCPDALPHRLLEGPGGPWQLRETSIKPWPSCRHTHPAIEAALAVRAAFGGEPLSGDRLTAVTVESYPAALDVCDRADVSSTYAAKFSLQHCVAAALALDGIDFGAFDGAARDRLAGERGKVRLSVSAPFASAYPAHWGARVTVSLADGESRSAAVTDAKGDPEAPLSDEEMVAKARMLMRSGGIDEPDALIGAILAMADNAPVPELDILEPGGSA